MKISKIQLKQIIREEVIVLYLEKYDKDVYLLNEGLITEAEFLKRLGRKAIPWVTAAALGAGALAGPKSAIAGPPPERAVQVQVEPGTSSNMQLFLDKYPQAQNENYRQLLSRLVQQKANQSKMKIKNTYLENFDSFASFIKSLEGYEDESMEDIKSNWEVYVNTISQALDSVPVVTYYDNIDQVPANYINRNIPAFYDADQKKIFINPFFYFSGGKFNHTDFDEDMDEEHIHTAQNAAKESLEMPIAHMQTAAAVRLGIFLPQEESGISKEAYDYLTSPQEFHAKMFKLKSNTGADRLTKDLLLRLINSDNPPEVLRVIDPNKIDEVLKFLNMVAQAETQKTSQIT